jgi:hypothetical protein
MSIDLLTKFKFLQTILALEDLSPRAKIVAARLLDHCNSKTELCIPSYKCLAEGTGMGKRSVMKAVKELEKRGVIIVRRRKGTSNSFKFNWQMAAGAGSAAKHARENAPTSAKSGKPLVKDHVSPVVKDQVLPSARSRTSRSTQSCTLNLESTNQERNQESINRESKPFPGMGEDSDCQNQTPNKKDFFALSDRDRRLVLTSLSAAVVKDIAAEIHRQAPEIWPNSVDSEPIAFPGQVSNCLIT